MGSFFKILIACLALLSVPCFGGEGQQTLSKRYLVPEEYNQAQMQKIVDDMSFEIQRLNTEIIKLNAGG